VTLPPAPERATAERLTPGWLILGSVAVLALAARLLPVLRGGGLRGIGNYDDGVYYAAGTALASGLLPYRDFVLLHPPGVVLTLAPFGLLGQLLDDSTAFAAARVAWMLLGAINAVLVARLVRPVGGMAAAFGGAVYALSYPAIYTETTTLLVAPAQTCLLVALVLLAPARSSGTAARRAAVLAGLLLGVSATFKIWGVIAVAAVLAWLALGSRRRLTLPVAAGAAAGVTAVCLPFFLAAPALMWRMVVLAQLGRDSAGTPVLVKLGDVAGLGLHDPGPATVVAVLVGVGALLIAAARTAAGRSSVVLTIALTATLIASPSWFTHYPGLVAGPLAVAVGCGAGQVLAAVSRRRRSLSAGLVAGLALALAVQAYPQRHLDLLRRFPGAELARQVENVDGCVTADDPAALAHLRVLSRNLDRSCPFVADFSGYSYLLALERGQWTPRSRDPAWQEMYLGYLQSGSVAMSWRYLRDGALSPQTEAIIRSWPRLAKAGRFVLRQPR